MFIFKTKKIEPTDLEKLITHVISELRTLSEDTEEYQRATASLKTLVEARKVEAETAKPNRPSADTIVTVAGNLVGILAILNFEKTGVITSKAFSTILRPRI